MGVTGLLKFLAKAAPMAVRKVPLSAYSGRRVAVDTSIFMYQHMYARDHIGGFARQATLLLKHGIKPIFIFDGPPLEAKDDTMEARREVHAKNVSQKAIVKAQLDAAVKQQQQKREMTSAANAEITKLKKEHNKLSQRTLRPTFENFREVRRLFDLMGIPYLKAKHEADWLCAQLNSKSVVDAVLSNDGDLLTNRAPLLLTKYNSKDETVIEISLKKVLESLEITHDQFIDLCIMSGCDYVKDGIKGVGPAKGLKLLKKHGFIEPILDTMPKAPADFLAKAIEARKMFYLNPDDISGFDDTAFDIKALPKGEEAFLDFLKAHSRMKEAGRYALATELVTSVALL